MFSRKTKIVCSMGPTTASDDIVERLIFAGMNIARFNFSHGDHESHRIAMDRVRRMSEKTGIPVALLLDTKGPEIRTGVVANDGKIEIKAGDKIELTVDGSECYGADKGKPGHISLTWQDLPNKVKKGIKILIADGLIELDVESVSGNTVLTTAHNAGSIGSKKNVNLIGVHAGLPIMAPQDKDDIAFGVSQNIDFIAASFVSFPEEVREIRSYLDSLGSHARIIAKIENEEGVNNIDGIIAEADGIMVARGDLGVQLPTERIPLAQKHIIEEARKAGKPVITATQMLDSMIVNPRPTRAELTDVANAIFDGTDAVMLSGETANGAYPVEAVETMARIAQTVEDSDQYCKRIKANEPVMTDDVTLGRIMARMAYMTADQIKAMVIVGPTLSGHTARMISTFRPEQAILAVTPDPQVQRQLLLNWGVVPLLVPKIADDSEEMVQNAVKITLDAGFVHQSDRIVLCAGIPLASPIPVNTIRVLLVGNVLARGRSGGFNSSSTKVSGRIVKASTPDEARIELRHKKGEILLCPELNESWIPILRIIEGLIVIGSSELHSDTINLVK